MRIRFAEGDDAAKGQEIVEKIDRWWGEFQTRTTDLDQLFNGQKKWDLPAWMAEHLGAIDSRLMWEFGAGPNDGHRLVITPESNHHLRPLTRLILDRAPQIAGWSFVGQRFEDPDSAISYASERTGISLHAATVKAEPGTHGRIDVTIYLDDAKAAADKEAGRAAFVAVEYLCGERRLNQWIGAIDVAPKPHKSLFRKTPTDVGSPLKNLPALIESLINQHHHSLPEIPFHKLTSDPAYKLWKLTPSEGDDCAGCRDMHVGMSCYPAMWMAVRKCEMFSSERFSRFGETFCMLKIDGATGSERCEFADRGEIEDALDEALIASGLGRTIGGGTGQRYSYIDLALFELEPGIQVVRRRLSGTGLPLRSWILFFDVDLLAEWVGIDPAAPPPLLTIDP